MEDDLDVLIVGAGISGIGAAWHLRQQCPATSACSTRRTASAAPGVTHRYPGIRSDSDLFTFGYKFKPWMGKPIATADEILKLPGRGDRRERPGAAHPLPARHRGGAAGRQRRAALDAQRVHSTGQSGSSARFLWMCQGYYRHDVGYTPQWPGMDDFQGASCTRRPGPTTWS
jgi:cation diffusion facilitator CzcD-associated flavoprotein CzcO